MAWEADKRGVLSSDGRPGLAVSSPPEFKGEPGLWTREELFVAAVDACTMTTFMAFAERLQLPVVSYQSRADGVAEFVDGGYRFTSIVLRPVVRVRSVEAVEEVRQALRHESCLISHSIRADVVLEPTVSAA